MTKRKALVVEDDPRFSLTSKKMLENLGFEVVETLDCDKAVKEAKSVDVVVLDIHLDAEKNGRSILRRMRNAGNFVPVIAVSSHPELKSEVEGFGIVRWVDKPFREERFEEALGDTMGTVKALQSLNDSDDRMMRWIRRQEEKFDTQFAIPAVQ